MRTDSNSSTVCDILVKGYVDPDSFIEFRNLCEQVGLKHSAAVRTLIKQWISAHRKPKPARVEGPKLGQVIGVPGSFGNRVNYGGAPARLRP